MWFKKTELEKQIIRYDKDNDILLKFAKATGKPRIEDITLEDVKSYYTAIVEPLNARWDRNRHMLAIRKFFRAHRGENILKADYITDDPLKCVENIAIVEPMKKVTEKKRGPGRPRDLVNIKRAIAMRKEGIPFRKIALALDKDVSQIWVWWDKQKELLS